MNGYWIFINSWHITTQAALFVWMEGETSANIGETAPASELPGQITTKYWWQNISQYYRKILLIFGKQDICLGVSANLDLRVNSAKTQNPSQRKSCHQEVRKKIWQNLKRAHHWQKQKDLRMVWDRQRGKREIQLFHKNWEIPWKNLDDVKTFNFSSEIDKIYVDG